MIEDINIKILINGKQIEIDRKLEQFLKGLLGVNSNHKSIIEVMILSLIFIVKNEKKIHDDFEEYIINFNDLP